MSTTPPKLPKRPFVLLALMTIASFGGPVAFGVVLRGGQRPTWPPDRAVEWAALGGITALVLALMIVGIAMMVRNQREVARARQSRVG